MRPPSYRDVHAAVAAEDDALLVLGVPPHRAEVAEHAAHEIARSQVLPPSRVMYIESLVATTT